MPVARRKGWHPVGALPILEHADTLLSVSVWEAVFPGDRPRPSRGHGVAVQFELSLVLHTDFLSFDPPRPQVDSPTIQFYDPKV